MHDHPLGRRQGLCSFDIVAILSSFFKIECIGGFQHPLFQPIEYFTVFAVKELPCPLDTLHVDPAIHLTAADAFALIDVVVEAGPESRRE